jgi:hypothetical protein
MSGGHTQVLLASTPHVGKLSTIVRPVQGANVAVALTALAHAGAPQAPSSSFTTFQGFSGKETRLSKQSARLKPEGSPQNNSTKIAVFFLEPDHCDTFQGNQFIFFFKPLGSA